MKKLFITLLTIGCSFYSFGQSNKVWKEYDPIYVSSIKSDTVIKYFYHSNKDSVSRSKELSKKYGRIFSYADKDGNLKYKPCDSLTELNWWAKQWIYQKTITYVKGIKTSESKPYWYSRTSYMDDPIRTHEYKGRMYAGMSFTNAPREYYYNGKKINLIEILN